MSEEAERILAVCQSITDAAVAVDPLLRPYPMLRMATVAPAIVVAAGEPFQVFHQAFEFDEAVYNFDVVLLASKQNEIIAQKRLYGWLDPRGELYRAIDAIDGVSVETSGNVGDYSVGEGTYWGGTLHVSYSG